MTVVVVSGGRHYPDAERVFETLDRVNQEYGPISLLVEGGATGADYYAARWAIARDVPHQSVPANWVKEGRAAGPKRNQAILDGTRPKVAVFFPGGAGTADMRRRCEIAKKEYGLIIIEVVA